MVRANPPFNKTDFPLSQCQDQGRSAAPGLTLDQLCELANQAVCRSPSRDLLPARLRAALECDKAITATFKSADPRLNRDISIGQFLVAFGIKHHTICFIFPERRQELDVYLALIGNLDLKNMGGTCSTCTIKFSPANCCTPHRPIQDLPKLVHT